jgi:8-oxo-dGTP pyrophosphatase MutT (NUDIX family)
MKHGVVGVILREGKVLVIQRGPGVVYPGYWAAPSGRMEPGESQSETVVREVAEELGLEVEPIAKVWECPTDDGLYTLHWWTVRLLSNDLRLEPNEVSAARWVTPAEFFELEPTFEGDRGFFSDVLPKLTR